MPTSDHRVIRVLCTLALRSVLMEIADEFSRTEGATLAAQFRSSNALMQEIAQGLSADVAVLTDTAIATLIRDGKVFADSRRNLASADIGLAVRKGAPKPHIGDADALKRTLLAANSIAFSLNGASGIHFADVIMRLGIADSVRAKAKVQDGLVAELAARGDAEIAVQQISELIQVEGIDVIGPLPHELQKTSVFTAGIFTSAKDRSAAAALIAWLSTPEVATIIKSKGLKAPPA